MATIKRIDMVAFADHTDVAVTDRGVFTVKKTRGTDIYGMWKATKAYEIEVGPDDMKELCKDPHFYSISTDNFIDLCKKNGLLPDNKRYFIRKSDWAMTFAARDRGFRHIEGEGPYYQPTTKLVVFSIDDFVKCPQTKKELPEPFLIYFSQSFCMGIFIILNLILFSESKLSNNLIV